MGGRWLGGWKGWYLRGWVDGRCVNEWMDGEAVFCMGRWVDCRWMDGEVSGRPTCGWVDCRWMN